MGGTFMDFFDLFERGLAEELGITLEEYQIKIEEIPDEKFEEFCQCLFDKKNIERALEILYGKE